ncbi:hypothetical protein CLHOM_26750 [Clostridium homopropionicum DSM 5847]|uniref:DUF7922 domain-containing protein n=1 Tax=Clostridium homopropionicum DSM 5847 TaxID=1121318 RepID=A0A0L6Z7J2_9CLOT|nr:hypothetical protein CLHOM_26750 [Clostridium homopropionicum DSM 5847]SFG44039.1 hypothetical protein SAMN04488501_10980 [Clostridium homopropionicum]
MNIYYNNEKILEDLLSCMGGKPVATKKSYSRYFIILQEDEKGYSTDSSKFPTGYAKVERKNDKCKVSYYVQNLKRSKNPYYMVLICDRKADKRLLKLGTINIDDYGRAEVSCEYSAEDIASSNIPMESIKGAAIVSLEDSSVHGILSGFVSGSKLEDWKSYAVIENQENVKRQVSEAKEKEVELKSQKEKDNIFDKYESDIENAKNIEKDESTVPDLNIENREDEKVTKVVEEEIKASIDEKLEEALNPIEKQQIEEKDENRNKDEDHHKHDHEHHHECEHEEEYEHEHDHDDKCEHKHDHKHEYEYSHEDDEDDEEDLEEFFEDISEGFEEVKEICKEVGKCKWHKVPYEKLMNVRPYMHFNKYTMVYYPMFNYQPYIRKGGHYLFGYKLDLKGRVKYLVYAIPGTRRFLDQPYGGNTGFVTWVYKDDKKSDDGYWLMFYDFKNSRIVVPVKK